VRDIDITLDGVVIFVGEIARASGGVIGTSECFGDVRVFSVSFKLITCFGDVRVFSVSFKLIPCLGDVRVFSVSFKLITCLVLW